ncbi:MAG: TRAP transporter substrate-binding protein DctP [Proteobacteria bacterium]|nr:TRAP transporter substrate-binding protein DctP [Pseudomonadota bacterium]
MKSLAIMALALLLLAAPSCWSAGEPDEPESFRWRFATLAPDGAGWARQVRELVIPAVTRATAGRLRMKVYWGGILGLDGDYLARMKNKTLEGAGFSGRGATLAIPEMAVLELPFLFRDYGEVDFIKESMRDRFDSLASARGFRFLSWVDQGFDPLFSSKFPMNRLDHFRRARFQTWYGPVEEELFAALGATAVPVDPPDLPLAMRRQEVDANIAPALWMVGNQMFAVAKYINPMKLRYSPAPILVRAGAWDELPKAWQAAFRRERDSIERPFCQQVREDNEEAIQAMVQYGLILVETDPETLETIGRLARGVWTRTSGTLFPEDLLEELLGHLKKYRKERTGSSS